MYDIIKVFAFNRRYYRIQKGLSQEKLAEISGLHRTYISTVERKERSISLINIQKIALALNVEVYKLFIEIDEEWLFWMHGYNLKEIV